VHPTARKRGFYGSEERANEQEGRFERGEDAELEDGVKGAKSAAASALAQTGNKKVTGKAAASKAAKTLSSKSASKQAKSAAGSALTQKPRKRR
jgi:hypothetical protein